MTKGCALDLIAEKVAGCTKCCDLASYRKANAHRTVPGEGNPDARIVLVGEAPGESEAETGRPFVGRSGRLLDTLLRRVGLDRTRVFVLNTVKCKPPANRDPTRQEACNCEPFLSLQMKVIAPDYLVCVGRVAALNMLMPRGADEAWWFARSLGSLRGRFHDYNGVKAVCTYHPSYLLRNFSAEKHFVSDLEMVVEDQRAASSRC